MGRGTVESCAEETGRGDTIVVEGTLVVVSKGSTKDCASRSRDVDVARCFRQLHICLNHFFVAGCSPSWGLSMAVIVGSSLPRTNQFSCHDACQCQNSGCTPASAVPLSSARYVLVFKPQSTFYFLILHSFLSWLSSRAPQVSQSMVEALLITRARETSQ